MNVNANIDTPLVTSDAVGSAINVSETYWGYIIRKGGAAPRRAAWGEIAAMLACILFGIAAYSQWLLPGTINNVEVFPFKIAGTIVFFVFGFLNYSIARKGLLYETQIDEKRSSVRVARRNRDGVSTLINTYPFDDIGRIYTFRSKSGFVPDRLYLEPRSSTRPILVAMGPASELEPLRERLITDLRPSAQQQQKRATLPDRGAQKSQVRSAFAAQ